MSGMNFIEGRILLECPTPDCVSMKNPNQEKAFSFSRKGVGDN